MEPSDNFCRACLLKFQDSDELIHYTEKNRRQFVYVTGLQVKKNDSFVFQICKDCYANMKISSKFKKQCRTSHKTFQNYIESKATGYEGDFCTYLINTDDTFKFSYMNGYSTPIYKTIKEDDNESTCTSIRNFVKDFIKDDELPDTEAKIIKEVIEEEADILDDSLDSHWLQDDISVDKDFQLDFSLTGFSTPRSTNGDRCNTPLTELTKNYPFSPKAIPETVNTIQAKVIRPYTPKYSTSKDMPDLDSMFETNATEEVKIAHKYIPPTKKIVKLQNDPNTSEQSVPDTIDKNLETALKNEKKLIDLEDLIKSPAEKIVAVSPTVSDILREANIDNENSLSNNNYTHTIDNNYIQTNVGFSQCIETFKNVEGTELEDSFFNVDELTQAPKMNFYVESNIDQNEVTEAKNDKDDDDDDVISVGNEFEKDDPNKCRVFIEHVDPNDTEFDKEPKFQCAICSISFKSMSSLKSHSTAKHNIKIIYNAPKKKTVCVCYECGAEFSDKSNFSKHIMRHEAKKKQPEYFECDHCNIRFNTRHRIESHMKLHYKTNDRNKKSTDNKDKSIVCNICGATSTNRSNLTLHLRRHNKEYSCYCNQCGKGFFRNIELTRHMSTHTNEKPYKCTKCDASFKRRYLLLNHINSKHIKKKDFKCQFCSSSFSIKSRLSTHLSMSKKCLAKRKEMGVILESEQPQVSCYYGKVTNGKVTSIVTLNGVLKEGDLIVT